MQLKCSNIKCSNTFERPAWEIARSKNKNHFCSRSCSAKVTNLIPKRKRINKNCAFCNKAIWGRKKYCNDCKIKTLLKTNSETFVSKNSLTKAQMMTNDTQRYRRIRDQARRLAKSIGLLNKCHVCSYTNYVECCHIHSIESFSNDTLVSIINNPKNLLGLCPNHHWEFDHGLLKICPQ